MRVSKRYAEHLVNRQSPAAFSSVGAGTPRSATNSRPKTWTSEHLDSHDRPCVSPTKMFTPGHKGAGHTQNPAPMVPSTSKVRQEGAPGEDLIFTLPGLRYGATSGEHPSNVWEGDHAEPRPASCGRSATGRTAEPRLIVSAPGLVDSVAGIPGGSIRGISDVALSGCGVVAAVLSRRAVSPIAAASRSPTEMPHSDSAIWTRPVPTTVAGRLTTRSAVDLAVRP